MAKRHTPTDQTGKGGHFVAPLVKLKVIFTIFFFETQDLKTEMAGNIKYNLLILLLNISFLVTEALKNLARNLICFSFYEGKAEMGFHS